MDRPPFPSLPPSLYLRLTSDSAIRVVGLPAFLYLMDMAFRWATGFGSNLGIEAAADMYFLATAVTLSTLVEEGLSSIPGRRVLQATSLFLVCLILWTTALKLLSPLGLIPVAEILKTLMLAVIGILMFYLSSTFALRRRIVRDWYEARRDD